jgi:hypothetical protein
VLKHIDYKQLIKFGMSSIVIIPISITVLDSKQSEKMLPLSLMDSKIDNLFYINTEKEKGASIIYLSPVILTIDKKAYH